MTAELLIAISLYCGSANDILIPAKQCISKVITVCDKIVPNEDCVTQYMKMM